MESPYEKGWREIATDKPGRSTRDVIRPTATGATQEGVEVTEGLRYDTVEERVRRCRCVCRYVKEITWLD